MNLSKITRFIYEHALSMIKPWDDAILEVMNVPQLTSDGFRITSSLDPEYYVGMKESGSVIFVNVHCPGINYSSMAHPYAQQEANVFYNEMVDALLAA